METKNWAFASPGRPRAASRRVRRPPGRWSAVLETSFDPLLVAGSCRSPIRGRGARLGVHFIEEEPSGARSDTRRNGRLALLTMLGGVEVVCRVEQQDMGEAPREVAQQATRGGLTPRTAARRRCGSTEAGRSADGLVGAPWRARLSASQKVRGRKTPSSGGRPSTADSCRISGPAGASRGATTRPGPRPIPRPCRTTPGRRGRRARAGPG